MKLRAYKIGDVTYFCNELQIKEAGSLDRAAEKMAGLEMGSHQKMKPKAVKVEVQGEEPEEK